MLNHPLSLSFWWAQNLISLYGLCRYPFMSVLRIWQYIKTMCWWFSFLLPPAYLAISWCCEEKFDFDINPGFLRPKAIGKLLTYWSNLIPTGRNPFGCTEVSLLRDKFEGEPALATVAYCFCTHVQKQLLNTECMRTIKPRPGFPGRWPYTMLPLGRNYILSCKGGKSTIIWCFTIL